MDFWIVECEENIFSEGVNQRNLNSATKQFHSNPILVEWDYTIPLYIGCGLAPQIQFQWNWTNVIPPCGGLVHPNPIQNAKKPHFSSFRPLLLPKLITLSSPIQIERSKVI